MKCLYCNKELIGMRKGATYCTRKCKKKASIIRKWGSCMTASKKRKLGNPSPINIKKLKCEECGFIAIHRCQLDIDHIDGNRKNNDLSNIQILCANCHRLKTQINKDWSKNIYLC